jgi:hypothetical protein
MTWSFSENRIFKRCPRQWFYKAIFADSQATAPERQEAYLLSKLQTVASWRGQLVDLIAETFLIPALNRGESPTLRDTLREARQLFRKQLDFGRNHRLREPGMTPKKAGNAFLAFFKLEYGQKIEHEEFDQAWKDIETALRTLYGLGELRKMIREGEYRVAQRTLSFHHFDASVRARPDLVVFFKKRTPVILDWKVHFFGVHDAADQLTTYALALARANPHKDYLPFWKSWPPTEIELLEVQLLRGIIRQHPIGASEVQSADDRIAEGIMALRFACDGKRSNELVADNFPRAVESSVCERCSYRKICWRQQS